MNDRNRRYLEAYVHIQSAKPSYILCGVSKFPLLFYFSEKKQAFLKAEMRTEYYTGEEQLKKLLRNNVEQSEGKRNHERKIATSHTEIPGFAV